MPSTVSGRKEYDLFIERAIEGYKESMPRSALLAVGDEAVSHFVDGALTELRLCEEVDHLIYRRLALPSYKEWRTEYGLALQPQPALIDSAGHPVTADEFSAAGLLVIARTISDEMISALSDKPHSMYELESRRFEELVAELLCRQGVEVELTPASRDGGRDVIARLTTPVGACLCFVECKRYSPDRPVGVRVVRELFGVVSHAKATQGLIVTTSAFSAPARDFAATVPHQISLKAYLDVVDWLARAQAEIAKRSIGAIASTRLGMVTDIVR